MRVSSLLRSAWGLYSSVAVVYISTVIRVALTLNGSRNNTTNQIYFGLLLM